MNVLCIFRYSECDDGVLPALSGAKLFVCVSPHHDCCLRGGARRALKASVVEDVRQGLSASGVSWNRGGRFSFV